jgi:hypothetical protein
MKLSSFNEIGEFKLKELDKYQPIGGCVITAINQEIYQLMVQE